jgi:hypothetical protein
MSRKRFPNGRAIVQAITIETGIDPGGSCSGGVTLWCGHCGKLSKGEDGRAYSDPETCGVSFEEQKELFQNSLATS